MPPRVAAVNIKSDELVLQCEWLDCTQVFNCMTNFTEHANVHLMQHFSSDNTENTEDNQETGRQCHWRDCSSHIDGEPSCYLRHVYFHLFHVKIKCIGSLLLEKTGRQPCLFDTQSRNMIPELPECLQCSWEDCQMQFENADLFYRHVQSHTECLPDGNTVKGGCKCLWEGCSTMVKSKHKLKDHMKSHTQEKVVACPICGALFSCRTKFFDHLTRQSGYSTGKQYQCSYCSSKFAAERLLRDHMRHHVNQYKCPYCDMTSPSPSNMQLHIKYRHTDEKPYQCDACQYRGKSLSDLKRHQDTHSNDEVVRCQVPNCEYSAKNFRNLAQHFKRVHQSENMATYDCHICSSSFSRGALLSKHLRSKHKFNWPSGHSRFRYKRDPDGKWRLQTVRYESMDLTTPEVSNLVPVDDNTNTNATTTSDDTVTTNKPTTATSRQADTEQEMVDLDTACVISIYPKADIKHTDTGQSDGEDDDADLIDGVQACNGAHHKTLSHKANPQHSLATETSSEDTLKQHGRTLRSKRPTKYKNENSMNGHGVKKKVLKSKKVKLDITSKSKKNVKITGAKVKTTAASKARFSNDGDISLVGMEEETSEFGDDGNVSEEAIEIHVTSNSKGEYLLQMADSTNGGTSEISTTFTPELETYNLQMLGDVALQEHCANN